MKNIVKKEEKEDNVTELKVIEGGKLDLAGKIPPGEVNWLKYLDEGSVFITKEKNNFRNFIGTQFLLMMKTDHCARFRGYTKETADPFWVIMDRFCNVHALVEVLAILKPEQEEQEEDKDNE